MANERQQFACIVFLKSVCDSYLFWGPRKMYHLPFRIEIYVLAYIRVGARQAAAPRRSAPPSNSPEATRKCIPAFPAETIRYETDM